MGSPCYECPDRCVGCHGHCARWEAFQAECAAIRKARYDQIEPQLCRYKNRQAVFKRKHIGPWKRPGHK